MQVTNKLRDKAEREARGPHLSKKKRNAKRAKRRAAVRARGSYANIIDRQGAAPLSPEETA